MLEKQEVTLDTPLNEMHLSVRLANCLMGQRYHFGIDKKMPVVRDYINIPDAELLRMPNFGMRSLRLWHELTDHLRPKRSRGSILLGIALHHSKLHTLYSELHRLEEKTNGG